MRPGQQGLKPLETRQRLRQGSLIGLSGRLFSRRCFIIQWIQSYSSMDRRGGLTPGSLARVYRRHPNAAPVAGRQAAAKQDMIVGN